MNVTYSLASHIFPKTTFSSRTHEFTVLPHAFVSFSRFINKLTPAWPFSINPISYIEIAIWIDVSAITMINIIFKLTFVNDMVDFFAHTLNTTVCTNLTYDILVVLALSKLKCLINWFRTICNDILKFQWTKMRPFLLNSLQCNTRCLIINRTISQLITRTIISHIGWHVTAIVLWFIFIIFILVILWHVLSWWWLHLWLLLNHIYLLCTTHYLLWAHLVLLHNLHLMI